MIGSPGTQDRPPWSVRSGERSADLIKASDRPAAPTGRRDGGSQDHPAITSRKPLQGGRRPWMDQPEEERVNGAKVKLRLRPRRPRAGARPEREDVRTGAAEEAAARPDRGNARTDGVEVIRTAGGSGQNCGQPTLPGRGVLGSSPRTTGGDTGDACVSLASLATGRGRHTVRQVKMVVIGAGTSARWHCARPSTCATTSPISAAPPGRMRADSPDGSARSLDRQPLGGKPVANRYLVVSRMAS
jgi:hypothetical protein